MNIQNHTNHQLSTVFVSFSASLVFAIASLSSCGHAIEDSSKPVRSDKVDEKRPTVLETTPDNNFSDVDIYSTISVKFNEPIKHSSITQESVKLYKIPPNQSALLVELSNNNGLIIDNFTLKIKPKFALESGGLYQVILLANPDNEDSIQDLNGNVLEANNQETFTWSFTAASESTGTSEVLKSLSPAQDELVTNKLEPIVISLNPLLYGNADLNNISESIVVTYKELETVLKCDQSLNSYNAIKGEIEAKLDVNKIYFYPKSPGYPINTKIYAYICLKNKSGGEFLTKTWSFKIREGAIDDGISKRLVSQFGYTSISNSPLSSNILLDNFGNIIVTWIENNTTNIDHVLSARYDNVSEEWLLPDIIDNNTIESNQPIDNYNLHRSIVDIVGNVTVVWSQGMDLWANHYDIKSRSWQNNGPTKIYAAAIGQNVTLLTNDIQVDKTGNATIFFYSSSKDLNSKIVQNNIHAVRYNINTAAWESHKVLDNTTITKLERILSLKSLIDDAGNVTMFWKQNFDYWFSRYNNSKNTWQQSGPTKFLVSSNTETISLMPKNIISDKQGNILVTWVNKLNDVNNPRENLSAIRFNSTTESWDSPILLDKNNGLSGIISPNEFKLVTDNNGNVTVIWHQNNDFWTNHYDVQTNNWELLGPTNLLVTSISETKVDNFGNISILWFDYDPFAHIHLTLYNNSKKTWEAPFSIDRNLVDTQINYNQSILDDSGNITVIWGENNVYWANRLTNNNGSWSLSGSVNLFAQKEGERIFAPIQNSKSNIQGNVYFLWHKDKFDSLNGGLASSQLSLNFYNVQNNYWNLTPKILLNYSYPASKHIFLDKTHYVIDDSGSVTFFWHQESGEYWVNRFDYYSIVTQII